MPPHSWPSALLAQSPSASRAGKATRLDPGARGLEGVSWRQILLLGGSSWRVWGAHWKQPVIRASFRTLACWGVPAQPGALLHQDSKGGEGPRSQGGEKAMGQSWAAQQAASLGPLRNSPWPRPAGRPGAPSPLLQPRQLALGAGIDTKSPALPVLLGHPAATSVNPDVGQEEDSHCAQRDDIISRVHLEGPAGLVKKQGAVIPGSKR